MPNVAQHEAAELWEAARDHQVTAAKIEFFCNQINDPQLRSDLQQQARRFRQASQQLESFLQGSGSSQSFGTSNFNQGRSAFGSGQSFQSNQSFQSGQSFQPNSYGANSSFDAWAVAELLQTCKSMAVKAMLNATETSQPARNFLYQLAGEHLQLAEQHYHWLDQRGLYASPKADHNSIQQYAQKINEIAQLGQNIQRSYAGSSTYSQSQFQNAPQPAYSGSSYSQTAQQPSSTQFQQAGQTSQFNPSSQFSQPAPVGQSNPYNQQ